MNGVFNRMNGLGENLKKVGAASQSAASDLLALQMRALSRYADLGARQFRSALEVTSPEALNAFVSAQSETLQEIQGGFYDDLRESTEILTRFREDSAEALRQSFSSADDKGDAE